jgi:hypothetical protein
MIEMKLATPRNTSVGPTSEPLRVAVIGATANANAKRIADTVRNRSIRTRSTRLSASLPSVNQPNGLDLRAPAVRIDSNRRANRYRSRYHAPLCQQLPGMGELAALPLIGTRPPVSMRICLRGKRQYRPSTPPGRRRFDSSRFSILYRTSARP